MARKTAAGDPALSIDFFLSGFYTHRSQLFAPFKGIGVNVVSFHDPVIDGNNMEDTDLYEWSRRPGFSIYCPIPLADHEIVNQFYGTRNLAGVVTPWVDTTVRLAIFSTTSLTTILNKTTTEQGYVCTIGQMTYFSDGASADLTKFDGTNLTAWGLQAPTSIPVSSGQGFWQPDTHFSLGNTISDTNGNIETVTAILVPNGGVESPTAFSNLALAGGVGTWTGAVGPGDSISQTLVTIGHTNYLFFYDFNFGVPSGSTILGIVASVPKMVSGGTAVDQSVKLVISGVVAGTDQASATPWSTAGFATSTYGTPTYTWGATPTAAQINTNGLSGFGFAIAADVTSTTLFTLVQSGTANSENTSSTVFTFARPVTAGNTIVVGVHTFDEVLVTFSDGVNTYSQVVANTFGEHAHYVYLASNVAAGTTTLTVTVTQLHSNSFTCISAQEFAGILSASPVEVTGSNNSGGSPFVSPFNSGTVTIANASDMLFSYVYSENGGSVPAGYTPATSTSFSAAGAIQQLASAFFAPGATGTYSPSWSVGSQGATVALKSALSATVSVASGSPNAPVVTIYFQLPTGTGPGFSGANEPIWSITIGTSVNDGGLAWTNYGPIEIWYPVTNYPVPVVVLDSNGFLQLAVAVTNPVQPWDVGTGYTTGQVVSFGGGFWISVYASTNTGNAPNNLANVATTVAGVTTTAPFWAVAQNPSVTGAIAPVWNTNVGGKTTDGDYVWTNIGQGSFLATVGYSYVYSFRTIYDHLSTASEISNNTGAILGPLNGSISSYEISGGIVTFFGANNFIPGNVFEVTGLTTGTYLNNQTFTVLTAVDSAIFPLTSVAVSGSDVLTIQAINNLVAGQSVTFSNVGTATFLNGVTVTVLSGGLSGTQFEANFTHASYGPTGDTGNVQINGSWTADAPAGAPATVGLTADTGVALPLISTVSGTGTGSPLCNSVATITGYSVFQNIVTIYASNNFQPGIFVTIEGMTNATFLNGQQVEVIEVDQLLGTQNTQFQFEFVTPDAAVTPDTGTATFNAVEIYRVSDGGGLYLFAGAVTNPGAGLPWQYNDYVTDDNLDILLIAPLAHLNDPPPGGVGSTTKPVGTISVYWQGRIWLAVDHFVYFDSGPDCTNGIPEESWAPGNRFQFAGPVLALVPTPDGVGLLVYLSDRVNAILGGPETISFYPTDFLTNFGISNPNAVFRDGDASISQFTTQAQFFALMGKEKQEIGEHIGDYLAANFTSAKTYAAQYRNGLDVGVFLSNGVDRVLRYGNNISAWSVPAFPVFGAGALNAIETVAGTYSLMIGTPAGGVTSMTPSINPASGTSVLPAVLPWLNPGNIIAGNPTSYATVTFVGAPATSDILRAAFAEALSAVPTTAIVQGIQVSITGKQTDVTSDLNVKVAPTNAVAGAETHTFQFGTTNTTVVFGSATDTWGMPWTIPSVLNAGALSFDITAIYTGASTPEVFVSEVQVVITYQNPGNYLYARDVKSWGDGGTFAENDGQPYAECNITIGSITLSQLGAELFPLQHVVGYFDAVGTLNNGNSSYPDVWVLPNEIQPTTEVPFVLLPEVVQEPPTGQNHPSSSILALRWPVNMVNSSQMSQFIHHLQVKFQFEPENAPNTIKAVAFKQNQD